MAVVFGIDTGSWRLRVAAMEGTFGRFVLRDVQQIEVQVDPDGRLAHDRALLAMEASDPRWAVADMVAGFPLDEAAVRLVRLPFTDRRAIDRALLAEVEAQVPYDLEEMVVVPRLVDAREGQSRTLVLIAAREAVGARLDQLRSAKAEPERLPVDATALAAYADRNVQVVVDVGHRRTLLALCQNGQLLAARLVASGGQAITEAIARAGGLEIAAAEGLKHQMRLPARAGEAAAEWAEERTETQGRLPAGDAAADERLRLAAREAADDWAMDVRAELIALEDELGVGIDELLFCGGGSALQGLPEVLMGATGLPGRPVVVPGGYPPECALAVALARVASGELKVPDLRVGEFAHHGEAETLWNVAAAAVGGTVLALVLGLGVFGWKYWETGTRLDAVQAEVVSLVAATFPDVDPAAIPTANDALQVTNQRVAEVRARVDALGATVTGVPPMLETLRLLSEKVPAHGEARIDVRELTITEQAVSLRAETDSYESAAKIEEALKREPTFAQARKSDEKKLGEVLTFNLNIPLGADASDAAGATEGG